MLYIENLNGLGLKPTTKFVLYTILKRAFFENKNKIQMTYSYIARQTELSRSTVLREIEFLINSEYIKSERGLFKSQENVNRITHEITLTDKSISILNAEAAKPQNKAIKTEETQPQADVPKTENKPSNKPVNTEPRQPQAEAEKTPQQAPKQAKTEQADKVHESETEQTEEQAFQTEIEKMNAMYRSLNNIQKGCATALKRAKTDNPVIYIRDAQEQGVPQVLIDFILRYNKMKREEQKYENF